VEDKITNIKNRILEEIKPEKILYYKTTHLHLFVVLWDVEMSNYEKHIYLRKILRTVTIPFDVTTYTNEGFKRALQEQIYPTTDIAKFGTTLYEKVIHEGN
jgi:hypothetical protein